MWLQSSKWKISEEKNRTRSQMMKFYCFYVILKCAKELLSDSCDFSWALLILICSTLKGPRRASQKAIHHAGQQRSVVPWSKAVNLWVSDSLGCWVQTFTLQAKNSKRCNNLENVFSALSLCWTSSSRETTTANIAAVCPFQLPWDQQNTVGMIDQLKQYNLYEEGRRLCI